MISLFSYNLTTTELITLYIVAIGVGMAKTGVQGAGLMGVPFVAAIFGGRTSSGLILPMLVFADIMGVRYYHQHASWVHLKKLFPWTALGVVVGTIVGHSINDELFKLIMGIIIVGSVGVMIWLERSNKENVPHELWFAALMGSLAGFTSMVGNLATAPMAIYLLAMRLPKNVYIGTSAWFFLFINLFKVPFHFFVWHTINLNTFLLDLTTIPAIALGAFLGILIVRKIPEQWYRWFIIATTLVAAVLMLL